MPNDTTDQRLTDPEHVERLASELLAAHPYQHHPDNVQANLAAFVNLLTVKEAASTLRALSAKLQEPVEVKPLEWYRIGSERKASTPFGPYLVAEFERFEWACWLPNQDVDEEPGHGLHESESAAMDYGQQHCSAAIRAMLIDRGE